MLEKNIEKYLRLKIKRLDGLALKFVSPGFTGVMDRICLLPEGIIFFVELKQLNKQLRDRQKFVKKQFELLGMKVYKTDSKEKIDELCNMYQEIIKNLRQRK